MPEDDTVSWDPRELDDGPPWLTNRDKDEEPDYGFDLNEFSLVTGFSTASLTGWFPRLFGKT